jgi:hypothetical protein
MKTKLIHVKLTPAHIAAVCDGGWVNSQVLRANGGFA